jgi:hypothetical protein
VSDRHICVDLSERGCRDFLTLVSRTVDRDPELLTDLMGLIEAVAKGPQVSEKTILVQASAETHDLIDQKGLESMARAIAARIGEMVLTGDTQVTRLALVLHCEEYSPARSNNGSEASS